MSRRDRKAAKARRDRTRRVGPARDRQPLDVRVDIGLNIDTEDGYHLEAGALFAVFDKGPWPDDVRVHRVEAADLAGIVELIPRRLDALERATGRRVVAVPTFGGSSAAWRAVLAEHDLKVVDRRLVPALDD